MDNLKPNKLNKFIPCNATCPVECENYYTGEPISLGLNKPNEPNKLLWVSLCFIWFLTVGVPTMAHAELGDLFKYFQPYITVQEEYTSNVDLTPTNRREDYITTVSPGLRFSTLPRSEVARAQQAPSAEQKYGMDLDLQAGLVFYAKEEDNNFTSLNGALNAWYLFGQKLSFRVRDYLIRSDELRESEYSATAIEGQYLLSTQRKRVIYFRNVFEPSVDYQFGGENRISINYRNNIYEVQGQTLGDSQENYVNPRLIYWFNIRHGITLEYGLTLGDFESSPDLLGHMATGRYTYRFNPKTSIFGEYMFLIRDFESPSNDYDVHRPSLGISHSFSPTLSGSAQAGYFWQNPEKGSKTGGVYYDMSLTQRAEKTTYTLSFQGGYTEDYFTAENLGFTKYYRGIGTISHRLLERMSAGLSGYVERAEYPSDLADRKDLIWGIRANLSYEILKWLSVSLEGSRRENYSNIDTFDYSEYRGIFRITASF
jgi:hypothetical protein